jgi:hypothetical protein
MSNPNHFTPPPGPFTVYRDVLGVPGLFVLANVFTEEGERELFLSMGDLPDPRQDKAGHDARTTEFGARSPAFFPRCFFQALNVLCDTQVFEGYAIPDYMVAFAYPPGTSFMSHFDSR